MAIKSRRKVLVIYTYAIPTIPVVPARIYIYNYIKDPFSSIELARAVRN